MKVFNRSTVRHIRSTAPIAIGLLLWGLVSCDFRISDHGEETPIEIDYNGIIYHYGVAFSVEDWVKQYPPERIHDLFITHTDERGIRRDKKDDVDRLDRWVVQNGIPVFVRWAKGADAQSPNFTKPVGGLSILLEKP